MGYVKSVLVALIVSLPMLASGGESTLSWTAPITRADGTDFQLSEIEGYRVYHGVSDTALTLLAALPNTQTTYTHADVGLGAHYYAVTTVDMSGQESAFSNIVAKVFLAVPSSVTLTIQ